MIKINHTLQVLHICRNPIGDEGIAAIVTNLNNSMISAMDVHECNITVTGAKALTECLVHNHSIELLDVSSNNITLNGTTAILEAAVANKACQEVRINHEYCSDDKVKEMMSILKEKKRQYQLQVLCESLMCVNLYTVHIVMYSPYRQMLLTSDQLDDHIT